MEKVAPESSKSSPQNVQKIEYILYGAPEKRKKRFPTPPPPVTHTHTHIL